MSLITQSVSVKPKTQHLLCPKSSKTSSSMLGLVRTETSTDMSVRKFVSTRRRSKAGPKGTIVEVNRNVNSDVLTLMYVEVSVLTGSHVIAKYNLTHQSLTVFQRISRTMTNSKFYFSNDDERRGASSSKDGGEFL